MEILVLLVQLDLRERLVLKVRLERPALRERLVQLDLRERLVLKVRPERPVLREQQAQLGQQEQARLGQLDRQVLKARLGQLG